MSFEAYVLIAAVSLFVVIFGVIAALLLPKRIRHDRFTNRWKQLQELCADESKWPTAIIEADNLLGEGLKKKRFKGKNIGERMVEAQKNFTNNDAVWFGHKLRTKLELHPDMPLAKQDVQKALLGLRQGLKDIGVLR